MFSDKKKKPRHKKFHCKFHPICLKEINYQELPLDDQRFFELKISDCIDTAPNIIKNFCSYHKRKCNETQHETRKQVFRRTRVVVTGLHQSREL